MRSPVLVMLLALAAAPARAGEPAATQPAEAAPGAAMGPGPGPAVRVDWTVDGAITGGAVLLWGAAQAAGGHLMPDACRWCSPPGLDTSARDALRWSSPGAAGTGSDLLTAALPLGFAAYDWLHVRDASAVAGDVLVVGESAAIAALLSQGGKLLAARQRPYAWAGGGTGDADDRASFWSGHAAVAFAVAAAAGREAQLRGDPAWPWVYAAGFGAAGTVGYLRVAADQHWLTDVLAGAAVGTAVGLVVPSLHGRPSGGPGLTVLPAPGGILIAGQF